MADTNPLREKLADELAFFVERSRDCATAADRVLAVLAEWIGDGLLDANGQRWTKREAGHTGFRFCTPACADGCTVDHEAERAPLFVLERSGDDQ